MSQATTTQAKIDKWLVAKPLLEAMYAEFKELSKKKPDGALGKQKLTVVNRLLESCRLVLQAEPSMEFLDLLREEDIPQNSDVVLMLSQYIAAMEAYQSQYYRYNGRRHEWAVAK